MYSVIPIPLDTAGSREIRMTGDYMIFQDARRSDGSQALDTSLRVRVGRENSDQATIRLNAQFRGLFDSIQVEWDATAGVTAYLFVSRGPGGLELDAPPAKQLVTSAVGTTLASAAVTVGLTATLIAAADSLRQSLVVKNNGSNTVYLGGSGVTVAQGLPLAAGEAFTLSETTAALYGIASVATEVRKLAESS
jgi:hypothetical protein